MFNLTVFCALVAVATAQFSTTQFGGGNAVPSTGSMTNLQKNKELTSINNPSQFPTQPMPTSGSSLTQMNPNNFQQLTQEQQQTSRPTQGVTNTYQQQQQQTSRPTQGVTNMYQEQQTSNPTKPVTNTYQEQTTTPGRQTVTNQYTSGNTVNNPPDQYSPGKQTTYYEQSYTEQNNQQTRPSSSQSYQTQETYDNTYTSTHETQYPEHYSYTSYKPEQSWNTYEKYSSPIELSSTVLRPPSDIPFNSRPVPFTHSYQEYQVPSVSQQFNPVYSSQPAGGIMTMPVQQSGIRVVSGQPSVMKVVSTQPAGGMMTIPGQTSGMRVVSGQPSGMRVVSTQPSGGMMTIPGQTSGMTVISGQPSGGMMTMSGLQSGVMTMPGQQSGGMMVMSGEPVQMSSGPMMMGIQQGTMVAQPAELNKQKLIGVAVEKRTTGLGGIFNNLSGKTNLGTATLGQGLASNQASGLVGISNGMVGATQSPGVGSYGFSTTAVPVLGNGIVGGTAVPAGVRMAAVRKM